MKQSVGRKQNVNKFKVLTPISLSPYLALCLVRGLSMLMGRVDPQCRSPKRPITEDGAN